MRVVADRLRILISIYPTSPVFHVTEKTHIESLAARNMDLSPSSVAHGCLPRMVREAETLPVGLVPE